MHLAIVAAEPGEEASGGVEGLAKLRNVLLGSVLRHLRRRLLRLRLRLSLRFRSRRLPVLVVLRFLGREDALDGIASDLNRSH